MIRIICPKCKKTQAFQDKYAGQEGLCECGNRMLIPIPAEPESTKPTPVSVTVKHDHTSGCAGVVLLIILIFVLFVVMVSGPSNGTTSRPLAAPSEIQRSADPEKPRTDGALPAGSGFYYRNVSVKRSVGLEQVIGEMVNESGKSFVIANFIVSVYDAKSTLLDTGIANIGSFENGSTKSFDASFMGLDLKKADKFKIQFENGI